jgi:glutamine amidotransferase
MCRLFALFANQPTTVATSLMEAENNLRSQSCCDSRNEAHHDGWGIGYRSAGTIHRVRSTRPASRDPRYRRVVDMIRVSALVAHVRDASMGPVTIQNSHPFRHGRWLFAHNGTLAGFPAARRQIRAAIPADLRKRIRGQTDSEHAFYLLLANLRTITGNINAPCPPDAVCQAISQCVQYLQLLCHQTKEPSHFNFVLTNGAMLAASRWGHTLWFVERHSGNGILSDKPARPSAGYRAVAVASEPTTAENWTAVPERSILCVSRYVTASIVPIA